jgi:maltooligosyltrehalose trehalohydrolase
VAGNRAVFVVAENEPQNHRLVLPRSCGGHGATAIFNEDFHHTAIVAMTGRKEAYYSDYLGSPQEFVSIAKHGFLYQGQRYEWQKKRRGTPSLSSPRWKTVNFIENHDQVANSGRGSRVRTQTSPGRYRAMTAVLLLFPQTPLLFQGQEFGSSKTFFYFADHSGELAKTVNAGRRQFLAQFCSLATPEMRQLMRDPADPQTFLESKLDYAEKPRRGDFIKLHRDLLAIRSNDETIKNYENGLDGAVLGQECFVIRYFGREGDDRLLAVNFGRDLHFSPAPEPLLAPPAGACWAVQWSSEDPAYGGCGTSNPDGADNWRIPGHAALLLRPRLESEERSSE